MLECECRIIHLRFQNIQILYLDVLNYVVVRCFTICKKKKNQFNNDFLSFFIILKSRL